MALLHGLVAYRWSGTRGSERARRSVGGARGSQRACEAAARSESALPRPGSLSRERRCPPGGSAELRRTSGSLARARSFFWEFIIRGWGLFGGGEKESALQRFNVEIKGARLVCFIAGLTCCLLETKRGILFFHLNDLHPQPAGSPLFREEESGFHFE